MRTFAVSSAAAFLTFALLQLNDPDPARWVLAYTIAALFCAAHTLRPPPHTLTFLASATFAVAAVWAWPTTFQGVSGDMNASPEIELARESLGMLLCAAALIILAFLQRAREKRADSEGVTQ